MKRNKVNLEDLELSVIVPIYQQWDVIHCLLEALEVQTIPQGVWELIIVDNGSDDIPDLSCLDEFSFPIEFISCSTPGSYAARSKAVDLAQGRWLVFTDADCIPSSGWLSSLRGRFCEDQPRLLAGAMEVKCLHDRKPNIAELYDVTLGLPQKRYAEKGWGVTANLAIPRVIYDDVGGFETDRFSGGDSVFCLKARDKGYNLEYVTSAVVVHPARDSVYDLYRKFRRVKGGQIRSGSISRRLKYSIWTFVPPIRQVKEVFRSNKVTLSGKIRLFGFLLLLWTVEVLEFLRLLFGGTPERR